MELVIPLCLLNVMTFGAAACFGYIARNALQQSEITVNSGLGTSDRTYRRETEPFDFWYHTLLCCAAVIMFVAIGILGNIHLITTVD